MIPDEWSVNHDGVQYTWRHLDEQPVGSCWEWTDDLGRIPPAVIIQALNREFVKHHPLRSQPFSIAQILHPSPDMDRWRRILESMGAQFDSPVDPLEPDWQLESPLKQMGYKVGKQGLSERRRHLILCRAFEEELRDYGQPEYIAQWGEARSPARLRKIAENIASYCRNMKRKQNPSEEAIIQWEADLDWLRTEYFTGEMRNRFLWPSCLL